MSVFHVPSLCWQLAYFWNTVYKSWYTNFRSTGRKLENGANDEGDAEVNLPFTLTESRLHANAKVGTQASTGGLQRR